MPACANYGEDYSKNTYSKYIFKVFFSSPRWVISPQMVSLFLLLLRLPYKIPPFLKVNDYEGLAEVCKNGRKVGLGLSDGVYISEAFPYLEGIMGEYSTFFSGLSKEENFKSKNYSRPASREGIHALSKGVIAHKELKARFAKLIEKRNNQR